MLPIEQWLTEHGGLGGFLCLIALKIGEYIFHFVKNRIQVTDSTLESLKGALKENTTQLVATQAEMKKFRLDLRRAFFALQEVTGEEGWAKVSKKMQDKFPDL